MSGSPSSSPTIDLPRLRDAFDGQVIAPTTPPTTRRGRCLYGGWDSLPWSDRPSTDAGGVARVVDLAADAGLELAVRCGGHSNAGTAPPRAGSCSISR